MSRIFLGCILRPSIDICATEFFLDFELIDRSTVTVIVQKTVAFIVQSDRGPPTFYNHSNELCIEGSAPVLTDTQFEQMRSQIISATAPLKPKSRSLWFIRTTSNTPLDWYNDSAQFCESGGLKWQNRSPPFTAQLGVVEFCCQVLLASNTWRICNRWTQLYCMDEEYSFRDILTPPYC